MLLLFVSPIGVPPENASQCFFPVIDSRPLLIPRRLIPIIPTGQCLWSPIVVSGPDKGGGGAVTSLSNKRVINSNKPNKMRNEVECILSFEVVEQ